MINLVDAHCDTIVKLFTENKTLYDNDCSVSLKKLLAYKSPIQFFAICLHTDYLSFPFKDTLSFIDFFHEQINKNNTIIGTLEKFEDYTYNLSQNKISALLALEGAEALEGKLYNLDIFYDLGVRAITLTWNSKNELGYGNLCTESEGLTPFGKKVVQKMNNLGMIIDVSHLNELGFWDVYELSNKPFIASHSNAYHICNHKRNLNDEQIKAIHKANGVIGINLYTKFLGNSSVTIDDCLKHIDYIMNISSENNIGIGTDFDGCQNLPDGLKDTSDLIKIYQRLVTTYNKTIANKIMSGNFIRMIEEIL